MRLVCDNNCLVVLVIHVCVASSVFFSCFCCFLGVFVFCVTIEHNISFDVFSTILFGVFIAVINLSKYRPHSFCDLQRSLMSSQAISDA